MYKKAIDLEMEDNDVLISVIYSENKNCGTVHSSRLESLIKSGQIFAFRHSREWVIVGTDTVNSFEGATYEGLAMLEKDYSGCI
jgi:hypothetical protein